MLLLELRAEEQRRLADAFSLGTFHDTLLRGGSLPISFHRRALHGEGARPPGLAGQPSTPGSLGSPDSPSASPAPA